MGRFRLIEPLGSGGHGTVWAARDERLRRAVALKRIPREHNAKRDDRRRIDREALAAARLSHPAIVAFHEALSDADAYYLVTELVRGSSLAQRFARSRPDDRELVGIGIALADALAHAHARGVVHRDVKPQNVIIADDAVETGARAKLTDFGVAQIAGEQPLTRTGDVIGTLAYMSPEQADGKGATAASDLYALALTLYEGFSGTNPLRGATAVATVKRLSQGIPSLAIARPDLPRRLAAAIDRALSIDPSQRGRVSDLRDALASVRGGATAARARTLRRRRPQAAGRLTERGKRLVGATAAAVLGIVLSDEFLAVHGGMTLLCIGTAALLSVAFSPRSGWLLIALAAVVWAAITGEPGTALLLAAAFAATPLLLGSEPWLWCVPALAPALGVLGLAAAFPALAARLAGRSAWQRAALGALGYWWLAITEALSAHRLLFGAAASATPRSGWEGSASAAVTHVLSPLCTPGHLAPALLWAVAAVLLPWILRSASGASRIAFAALWAGALIVGCLIVAHSAGAPNPPLPLGAAALGALLALSFRAAPLRLPARPGVA
jgi:tRNA A-37 threonylcarbamoyl transferase component Bud32